MKKTFDLNVEALRGFCAVMVIVHHSIIFSNILNPGFDFRKTVIPYSPSGHLMVLIFFMLSGYVIGLNHVNKKFVVSDYLKRRAIRLYPIYIIAILITIMLFSEKLRTVIGTLFFTQNLLSETPEHNKVLWSLNHEVIYYLLVIPILIYRIKPAIVFLLITTLLLVSVGKLQFPMIIEGYLVGFIFWFMGFALSKIKLTQQNSVVNSPDKIVAMFLLLLGCDFLNPLGRILSHFHPLHGTSHYSLDGMVSFGDICSLPFCLFAIIIASSVNVKWGKFLTLFVYVGCWAYLFYLVINGSFFAVSFFYTPVFFLFLSTLLFFSPVRIFKSISLWVKAGSISYAMYVIHIPILEYIGKFSYFNGNLLLFIIKFIVLFIVVILIAYLLEKKLQPYIKTLINRTF